jgi:hypothetical protein
MMEACRQKKREIEHSIAHLQCYPEYFIFADLRYGLSDEIKEQVLSLLRKTYDGVTISYEEGDESRSFTWRKIEGHESCFYCVVVNGPDSKTVRKRTQEIYRIIRDKFEQDPCSLFLVGEG